MQPSGGGHIGEPSEITLAYQDERRRAPDAGGRRELDVPAWTYKLTKRMAAVVNVVVLLAGGGCCCCCFLARSLARRLVHVR